MSDLSFITTWLGSISQFVLFLQANWLYGNITEDETQNRVTPVRVSSVYDYPEGSQPDGVENQELYSLVTAPQNTVNRIMVWF